MYAIIDLKLNIPTKIGIYKNPLSNLYTLYKNIDTLYKILYKNIFKNIDTLYKNLAIFSSDCAYITLDYLSNFKKFYH